MSQASNNPILVVKNLSKSFGAIVAANDINLNFLSYETVGIIGANGAGKTTFVNMITGYTKPTKGNIYYLNQNITGIKSYKLTRAGLCRSFQIPQIFSSLTVYENILMSLGIAQGGALPGIKLLDNNHRANEVEELLVQFSLLNYRSQPVGKLSQGVRKLVDIAMAAASKPKLLILDEPTSGISSEEKFDVMEIIMGALLQQKVTVFFVEHDMDIVSKYSDRLLAFYDGSVIADGIPSQVLNEKLVKEYVIGSHLGESENSQM